MPPPSRPRIDAVDYLRGLFALSILAYHFVVWSKLEPTGFLRDLPGKFGVYGVAAFYVISGVSFGYVYQQLTLRPKVLAAFYLKRAFRLLPLFWLAMAGTIVLSREVPSVSDLALNATLTFGILSPATYIPTGG